MTTSTPTPISKARPVGTQRLTLPAKTAAAPTAAPEQKPAEPKRSLLANATTGRLASPFRILVYGEPGVGKTSLAAGAPRPIFLCSEDGTDELNVTRLRISSWQELLDTLDELETTAHPYETIVLDTLDHFESLLVQFICARDGYANIEGYGFYKGQKTVAPAEARVLAARLEKLNRRFNVILLAHSARKKIKKPDAEDYDAYGLKMFDDTSAFWVEWAVAALFARHEVVTYKGDDKKTRGTATGERTLKCHFGAAWLAKNRYGLPEEMPLDWQTLETEIRTGRAILRELDGLSEQVSGLDVENGRIAQAWLSKPHSREELQMMRETMIALIEKKKTPAIEPEKG